MNLLKKIYRKAHALTEDFWLKRRHIRIDNGYLHVGYLLPNLDFSNIPTIVGFAHVGIVLQGPIDRNEDFTINTIRLFRHIYPEVKLVFATWKGELNESEKRIIKEQKCELLELESCPPEFKGKGRKIGHLNNQLLSSLEGIKILKRMGAEYVLKIRTDVRLYKYDFIPYFMNLISQYPYVGKIQNCRLLNVSFLNTLASVPFHMSDFIWFGEIEDMERLYSIPNRKKEVLDKISNMTNEEIETHTAMFWERSHTYNPHDVQWLNPTNENIEIFQYSHIEAYIMYTYASMNQLCDPAISPIDAYYRFLRDDVIVVDENELFAYWDKYKTSHNKNVYAEFYRMRHSEWLDLVLNYKNR